MNNITICHTKGFSEFIKGLSIIVVTAGLTNTAHAGENQNYLFINAEAGLTVPTSKKNLLNSFATVGGSAGMVFKNLDGIGMDVAPAGSVHVSVANASELAGVKLNYTRILGRIDVGYLPKNGWKIAVAPEIAWEDISGNTTVSGNQVTFGGSLLAGYSGETFGINLRGGCLTGKVNSCQIITGININF